MNAFISFLGIIFDFGIFFLFLWFVVYILRKVARLFSNQSSRSEDFSYTQKPFLESRHEHEFFRNVHEVVKDKPYEDYLPYVKKYYLMTKAEHEFFKVLQEVVQDKYYIVPQLQLSKLIKVEKNKKWEYAYTNKIDRKSVDFVLFNKEYFTPYLVIELDDSSHLREDRQARDNFVDEVLNKAGIRIEHIKTSYNYNLNEVSDTIGL